MVSRSSTEDKYRSMANATCEGVWLLYLLEQSKIDHKKPILLYCDNQATLHIANNLVFYERAKYMEMD